MVHLSVQVTKAASAAMTVTRGQSAGGNNAFRKVKDMQKKNDDYHLESLHSPSKQENK